MRRTGPALLFLALLPILTAPADAQRGGRRGWGRTPEFKHLTFESKSFKSKAMKKSWRYGIFLPKDYAKDKNKTYPWIIQLHGMNEDYRRFSFRGGAEVLDEMIGKKRFPKVVLVSAEGGRASFFLNGKYTLNYEDMVVEDLIAHIEKTYRVKKGRDHLALLGQSAGGGGALRIALHHPQVFGVVATHSAAILPKKSEDLYKEFPWLSGRSSALVVAMFGEPVDQKMWRHSNPLCLAAKMKPEDLHGLKIYFDCGTRDRYGFHAPNLAFHKLLEKRKIKHEWRSVSGGGHGNNYNADQLPHSLGFIAAAWSQQRGLKGLGGLMGGKTGDEDGAEAGKDPDSRPSRSIK
ncbi:MAG: alpha/beta hydrolase [Planctomycetota bacterium]|jgi:enterochelin esterase-like enzyme